MSQTKKFCASFRKCPPIEKYYKCVPLQCTLSKKPNIYTTHLECSFNESACISVINLAIKILLNWLTFFQYGRPLQLAKI